MGYSTNLRKKAVAYRMAGHTAAETSGGFGVGKDTLNRWMKQYRETDTLSPKPLNRTFKKIDPMKLKNFVKEHPDAILMDNASFHRKNRRNAIAENYHMTLIFLPLILLI